MSDILFYHLTRQPLEAVLPGLLERTLERGKRAVVQASGRERLEALDALLWTYRDDGFLPHGLHDGPFPERQPVLLTEGGAAPNGAQFCFLLDGAEPRTADDFERIAILFDGRDEEAVARARDLWRALKPGAHVLTYWQQDEAGRWEKKA